MYYTIFHGVYRVVRKTTRHPVRAAVIGIFCTARMKLLTGNLGTGAAAAAAAEVV